MDAPRSEPDRLIEQAEAWAPVTAAALDRIGIRRGSHCLELGCGPLGILDLLSARVGRSGRVVGLDRDPSILVAALDQIAERKLPNVELRIGRATATGLPSASFDLVHARLVAQETGLGPLVGEMARLVRRGGWLLLEEPGPEPWEIEPAPPGFAALAPAVTAAFLPRPRSTGRALAAALRRRGLVGVSSRSERLELRGGEPFAGTPLFALARARPRLQAAGAGSADAIDRLHRALRTACRDPETRHRSWPLWQAWGRKR